MQKIGKCVATLFFVGYIPKAPGTAASLAGLALYLLVKDYAFVYCFITVLFLMLGFWSASLSEKSFSKKDPPQIVIDEFSSVFLVYLFIPFSPKLLIIGFVLFRLLDIYKIPPIKKLQTLPSGFGIMCDDIAAGLLANLILRILPFLRIVG